MIRGQVEDGNTKGFFVSFQKNINIEAEMRVYLGLFGGRGHFQLLSNFTLFSAFRVHS